VRYNDNSLIVSSHRSEIRHSGHLNPIWKSRSLGSTEICFVGIFLRRGLRTADSSLVLSSFRNQILEFVDQVALIRLK